MRPTEIRSYDDLVAALRARKVELDVSCLTVDAVAGLAPGHASKLLSFSRIKGLGAVSLPLILGGLGLKLLLVEDREQFRRIRGRLTKRRPGRREIEAPPAAPVALATPAEEPGAEQRERRAASFWGDPPELCG